MLCYILLFWNFIIQAAIFVGSSIVSSILNQKTVETGTVDRFSKPEGYGQNIPTGYGLIKTSGIYVWAEEPTKIVNEREEGGFFGIGGTTFRETSYTGNFALLFCDVPDGYIAFLNRLVINGETAFWDKNIANTIINSYNQAAFEALYRNDNFEDTWYYTTITEGLIQTRLSLPEAIDRTNAGTEEDRAIARNNCYWANKIKFFTGDDEQTNPAWMGSKVGANNVAAWQRFAYCTVKDFPLTQYGNAFPRIEAIISIVPKITTLGTAGRKGYYFQVVVAGIYLGNIDKKPFAVPLADIVASICLRSGLNETEFDVSDLARIEGNKKELVRGIKIEQNGEGFREPIAELQSIFLFGCREENGSLNFEFFRRGNAVIPLKIDLAELGCYEDGSGSLPERFLDTRLQEIEIPATISLSYLDYELLLDRNEARVDKELNRRVETINTSIVLTLSEASTATKRLLEQVWIQRQQFTLSLPPRRADIIAPNLPIELPIMGSRYLILPQEITMGVNLRSEIRGVLYETAALGEELELINERQPAITLNQGFISISYHVLDIPLINDSHADHTLYFVASDFCTLINSDSQNGTYNSVGQFSPHSGAIGICENALNGSVNTYLFDRSSELIVKISHNADTLESKTFDETLALANLALAGDELISFGTVTPLGGDRYKITNLARGCRGTDRRINTHVAGERFILLGGHPPSRFAGNDSLVNINRYFKALATGQLESDISNSSVLTYRARSNQLYLPNLRYGRLSNGDLEILYSLRSRNNTNFGRVANRDPIEAILISIIINNQSRAYSLDYDSAIANRKVITIAELSSLFGFTVTSNSQISITTN